MSVSAIPAIEALMVSCTSPGASGEYGLACTMALDTPPEQVLQLVGEMRLAMRAYEEKHGLERGVDRLEWQRVSLDEEE